LLKQTAGDHSFFDTRNNQCAQGSKGTITVLPLGAKNLRSRLTFAIIEILNRRQFSTLLLIAAVSCKPKAPRQIIAEPGDVADIVKKEAQKAESLGQHLVVYVSAPWCAPCQMFQEQLHDGEVNAQLAHLTFLKFDEDRDAERLRSAGYNGEYVPRFVLPQADGKASAKRFEGVIKSNDMLAQIRDQLTQLVPPP
jgi:thiol:disulfide interchange protein